MRTGQISKVIKKKSKCHGSRKLQHYKPKCRSHGMTTGEITELNNKRNNDPAKKNVNKLLKSKNDNNNVKRSIKKKKNQVRKRK